MPVIIRTERFFGLHKSDAEVSEQKASHVQLTRDPLVTMPGYFGTFVVVEQPDTVAVHQENTAITSGKLSPQILTREQINDADLRIQYPQPTRREKLSLTQRRIRYQA